jgi:phage terminase large subunit
MSLRIEVPSKFIPIFQPGPQFKVLHGGRGSAKSHTVAKKLVLDAYSGRERILCTREFQTSIADSVHKLVTDQIEGMKLRPWFDVTKSSIRCVLTGSEFLFKGLRHNIEEIKSTEGITKTWIEEARSASRNSLDVLFPTIFRTPGAECYITFNPEEATDPVYADFVEKRDPTALVIQGNWRDNRWFPEGLEMQRQRAIRLGDEDAYDWIWEGRLRKLSAAAIFRKKVSFETFEPPEVVDRFYYGIDWGFADDPTVLIRCYIVDEVLYIDREVFGYGVELDDLPALFSTIPGYRDWPIKADNSRPETISHVARKGGMAITAARKWQGSVEDGIEHLRSYRRIVIHETRCPNMAEEARLYSYKTDRISGAILPIVNDAHNHGWDAVRYALDDLIESGGAAASWANL